MKYLVLYPNENGHGGLSAKEFDDAREAAEYAIKNNGYIVIPATIQTDILTEEQTSNEIISY